MHADQLLRRAASILGALGMILLAGGTAKAAPVLYDLSFVQTSGAPINVVGEFIIDAPPPSTGAAIYSPDAQNGHELLGLTIVVDTTQFFTAQDDSQYPVSPQATFQDGGFLGLEATMFAGNVSFATIENRWGLFDADSNELASGTYTAAADSTVVPVPAALPLAVSAFAVLGGLGLLKRRRTHANVTAAI